MDFYIANKIRIPLLSSIETICYMLVVFVPMGLFLRLIEVVISKRYTKKYRHVAVVEICDEGIKLKRKKRYVKIPYNAIKSTTYASFAISVFDLTSFFENETVEQEYGKLTIKTYKKSYVVKYLMYGEVAKNMILEKMNIL